MARDTRSLTIARFHEVEDCEPMPEAVKDAARRVIAANAPDHLSLGEQVADTTLLLQMLGIYPGQEEELDYLTGPAPVVNDSSTRLVRTLW